MYTDVHQPGLVHGVSFGFNVPTHQCLDLLNRPRGRQLGEQAAQVRICSNSLARGLRSL